jgi:hypothetical protein
MSTQLTNYNFVPKRVQSRWFIKFVGSKLINRVLTGLIYICHLIRTIDRNLVKLFLTRI